MKKLTFTLVLALFSLVLFSQIEKPISKGNLIISGGGIIQNSITEGTKDFIGTQKTFNISFNPSLGYFIVNNLTIGICTSLGYSNTRTKYQNSNYSGYVKEISYGIGPYVKYYSNKGFFLKAESFYLYTIYRNYSGSETNFYFNFYYKDLSFAPSIGYALFINQKVSMEPSLGYRFKHSLQKDFGSFVPIKTNEIFFELSFNLFL